MLEQDGEKARGIIKEAKKIATREEQLAQYIGDIDHMYAITYANYPINIITERGIQFKYKSIATRSLPIPLVDLVVSFGKPNEDQDLTKEDICAWIRAEFYDEEHTEGDKPIISKTFLLGKHQVGVELDGSLSFLPVANVHVEDNLEYIREAISAIKPE